MKEKKEIKIKLATAIIAVLILTIIVLGIVIAFLYKKNVEQANSQSEINKSITQGEKTYSASNNNSNNKPISFTDEQVKTALSNYLELLAYARVDGLLWKLTEKGNLNYDSSKDIISNDGIITTTIKFSDYKNAMLNYVSENEFEKNWGKIQYFDENSEGYLTKVEGGGGLGVYAINSITKTNNSTYSAKTTVTYVDADNAKEDENFTFTVTSYNDNCVIDSIQEVINNSNTITTQEDKYMEITNNNNLKDNEVLKITNVEKNNEKYMLKGTVYETPYTISSNELNECVKKGQMTLNIFGEKKEYLLRKNQNLDSSKILYSLYSKENENQNREWFAEYDILKKDSNTYYIEGTTEYSDVYKTTEKYRKLTVDGSTLCKWIDAGVDYVNDTVEKVFKKGAFGEWKFKFKNEKCVEVYMINTGH